MSEKYVIWLLESIWINVEEFKQKTGNNISSISSQNTMQNSQIAIQSPNTMYSIAKLFTQEMCFMRDKIQSFPNWYT